MASLVDASVAAIGADSLAPAPDAWAYVAPEQTGRVNRTVDHRADLYALGIVLYRMLTARLPDALRCQADRARGAAGHDRRADESGLDL